MPAKAPIKLMGTTAEQLWSAKTRGYIEFDTIAPMKGLDQGGVGVAAGKKGSAAFFSYIKQPIVIARLQAEGFELAGGKAPHPWFLVTKPGGVVSPTHKARCRSLTVPERAKIETNRLAALKRRESAYTARVRDEAAARTLGFTRAV